jgi:lysophospholipase L1-like esterase
MSPVSKSLDDLRIGLLDADDGEHDRVDLLDENGEPLGFAPQTFRQLIGASITFALCILLSYVVPGLEGVQPWRVDEDYVPFWNLVGRELLGQGEREAARDEQVEQFQDLARALDDEDSVVPPPVRPPVTPPDTDAYPAYEPHEIDGAPVERELEFVDQLDPFYATLTRTDLGFPNAVTRASHWGDSVLGNDGITSAIRRMMQSRFGDAGHGFHAMSKYTASYRHRGIRFSERKGWKACSVNYRCRDDGHYGYGGVTAYSRGSGESRFGNARRGAFGREVSRFELWYAAQPKGGKLRITVDGEEHSLIDTRADVLEDRWEVVEVPAGAHRFVVESVGPGRARTYGVVLEREGPGVVWDGMALTGAFTNRMLDIDPEHFGRQLEHRETNLLVFTFGGNDMGRGGRKKDMQKYEDEYTQVVRLARKAKPDAPCLLVSPVDHGERSGRTIVTRPIVEPMIEAQRKVAEAEGCAFFDLYSAMGGEGSMGRWYRSDPALGSPDLAHPTAHGHKVIGALIYRALMKGYADFRQRKAGEPM